MMGVGGEKAWMTAGTFREKQAEGKVTYRDKQERERGRDRQTEKDADRPAAAGQAEESNPSCGLEKHAPASCVNCPSPRVPIQRPSPVLYPCINLSKAQPQQSVLGEARAASRQLSKILL